MALWQEDPDIQPLVVLKKLLDEAQSAPFDGKKNCWVPDDKEGFSSAEITGTKGEEVSIRTVEKNEVCHHEHTQIHGILISKNLIQ